MIDEDACALHGDCAELAPEIFEVDDVARVISTGPDDLVVGAARLCPSSAIRVVDELTGEQIYP
jgi:ferredoxin